MLWPRINRVGIVWLLALVLFPQASWAAFGMTFASNAGTTVYTSSTTASVTISATSGDTICFWTDAASGNRTMNVADDKSGGSNTYTRMAVIQDITAAISLWVDCTVSAGSVTTVTGTISSTIAGNSHAVAWVITGARSSIGTPNAVTHLTSPTGTSHASGTLTITDATALYIGGSSHSGTGGLTIDSNYTSRYSQTGIIVGDHAVSASEGMTNTTAGNRVAATALVEIRPAAASDDSGGLNLLGVEQ